MGQRRGWLWQGIVMVGSALAVETGCVASLAAQDKKEAWEILLAYDKNAKPTFAGIALRPNAEQQVFVYLKNAGADSRKKMTAALVRVDEGGKAQVLGEAAVDKLAANQLELLKFKPLPPPKGEPPPKDGPPALSLPFHLQIWLSKEGKKDTAKIDIPVSIEQPHEYVNATASYDRQQNLLSVDVSPVRREYTVPPIKVKLDLAPELIRGLLPDKDKKGLFEEDLTAAKPARKLFANLQFDQGIPPKSGRVSLTIDGYQRDVMFQGLFAGGNLPPLRVRNRVRLLMPRYFNPQADAKNPDRLEVRLELDGLLEQPGGGKVEVAFDRGGAGEFVIEREFPALRDRALTLQVDEGVLRCKTIVKEWNLVIPTAGVAGGKHAVRVRIVNAKGQPLELADEEYLSYFDPNPTRNRHAPLRFDAAAKAVYADIIFDSTGAEGVRFVDLPKALDPGEEFKVQATAKLRDDKNQAPLAKVRFFVGDAKEPVPATWDKTRNLWQGDLTIPADAKTKLPVKVEFITALDVLAAKTEFIKIGRAGGGGAGGATGDIQITVKWNNIGQPDAKVMLKEDKGGKSFTNKGKGVYELKKVKPGDYTVTVTKTGYEPASLAVTVSSGETTVEAIAIKKRR